MHDSGASRRGNAEACFVVIARSEAQSSFLFLGIESWIASAFALRATVDTSLGSQ
jgi:hypothetical protein